MPALFQTGGISYEENTLLLGLVIFESSSWELVYQHQIKHPNQGSTLLDPESVKERFLLQFLMPREPCSATVEIILPLESLSVSRLRLQAVEDLKFLI